MHFNPRNRGTLPKRRRIGLFEEHITETYKQGCNYAKNFVRTLINGNDDIISLINEIKPHKGWLILNNLYKNIFYTNTTCFMHTQG